MCGRYASTANPALLAVELDAIDETGEAESSANYNVAPTNQVLTVLQRRDHGADEDARMRVRLMRWGLIPSWVAAAEPGVPGTGKPLYNARAETASTANAFREGVRRRRCLVPMDGWYEWLTEPAPESLGASKKSRARKQPYYMSTDDGSRLYMAGLWSWWRDPAHHELPPVLSCTILTTDAVGDLQNIHSRMPLPMPREHWAAWLDPENPAPQALLAPPEPATVADIIARPVSTLVNSVRNNGPQLLDPLTQ